MDDLEMISTMLTKPPPSEDVVERGRLALQAGPGRPARRRPVGRLTGGLSLTAAAAAVAVVAVVSQTGAPAPSTPSPPAGAVAQPGEGRELSGQQVLLAAASTAEALPDRTGNYWHVRLEVDPVTGTAPPRDDLWTGRDGVTWSRSDGPDKPLVRVPGPAGFGVADGMLTFAQLQQLPTTPDALTRWVRKSLTHPPRVASVDDWPKGSPAPRVIIPSTPPELLPYMTVDALTALLYWTPAPAAVRAAAFRALAAMPTVRNLGPVAGGQALRITLPPLLVDKYGHYSDRAPVDHVDMVIDPATAMISRITDHQGTTRVQAAEWTDHLPR